MMVHDFTHITNVDVERSPLVGANKLVASWMALPAKGHPNATILVLHVLWKNGNWGAIPHHKDERIALDFRRGRNRSHLKTHCTLMPVLCKLLF
jgi:hypothetical protein